MRVCEVILSPAIGGGEYVARALTGALASYNVDAGLVSLFSDGSWREDLVRQCNLITLDMRSTYDFRVTASIVRYLSKTRPDVVHTHHPLAAVLVHPLAKAMRVPLCVQTIHVVMDQFRLQRRTTRHGSLANLRYRTAYLLADPFTDSYVAVADAVAAEFRQLVHCKGQRLAVVHNGIPVSSYRVTRSAPRRATNVLTLARISPEKGLHFLLRAAALVVKTHAEVRFRIAGAPNPGQQWYFDALVQMLDDLALRQHVSFVGPVSDVRPLLEEADLFVLPSLAEGLPISVLEAMAAGVPVVATDVGGTREILLPDAGLLVPPASCEKLAQAISTVISDRQVWLSLRAAAATRVTSFHVSHMASQYLRLFTDGTLVH